MTKLYEGRVGIDKFSIEQGKSFKLIEVDSNEEIEVIVDAVEYAYVVDTDLMHVGVIGTLTGEEPAYEPKDEIDRVAYELYQNLNSQPGPIGDIFGRAIIKPEGVEVYPVETKLPIIKNVMAYDNGGYLFLSKQLDKGVEGEQDSYYIVGFGRIDNDDLQGTAQSDLEDFPISSTIVAIAAMSDSHENIADYLTRDPMRLMKYSLEMNQGIQKNIDNGHITEEELREQIAKGVKG